MNMVTVPMKAEMPKSLYNDKAYIFLKYNTVADDNIKGTNIIKYIMTNEPMIDLKSMESNP